MHCWWLMTSWIFSSQCLIWQAYKARRFTVDWTFFHIMICHVEISHSMSRMTSWLRMTWYELILIKAFTMIWSVMTAAEWFLTQQIVSLLILNSASMIDQCSDLMTSLADELYENIMIFLILYFFIKIFTHFWFSDSSLNRIFWDMSHQHIISL